MSFWSGYMALRCKARSWRVWRHFSPVSTGHRCNHGAPLRCCCSIQHRPRHRKRRQRMRRNELHPSDCFGTFGAYRPLSSCWSVLCFVISKLDLGILGSGDGKPGGPAWSESRATFVPFRSLCFLPYLFPYLLPAVVGSNVCYFRCEMEMGLSSIQKKKINLQKYWCLENTSVVD